MHLYDVLGLAAAQPGLQRAMRELPPLPPDCRHFLLSGPERCGKTSLLFHIALSLARQGRAVLLLCRREKLEQVPPLLPEGVLNSDPAWERVHLKYVASGYELLRYVSHMHALAPPPDLLLVDDLHALVDLPAGDRPRPRDMALCRVLAALHEAANAASQLNARPCQLVATETAPADGPRLLYILQRWLPMVLHIRPVGQANLLSLLSCPRADVPPACHSQLVFSLKHGSLLLEDVRPPAALAPQGAWPSGGGGWH